MYGRMIALDKYSGIRLVGVVETRRRLFSKCMPRFTGTEATRAFQNDHIFDGLKAGIYGTVHRVQDI